ncbi:MAG: GNAT family N-acetyltransferase [Frankia sp.]
MSDLELRPFTASFFPAALRFLDRVFGAPFGSLETEAPLFEPDRSLGAYLGSDLVGTTWIQSLRLEVPGGSRAVAGVTGVGVSPVHRRRGVLRALMDRQLADIHERGEEALAALWASEPTIYGRFGYGLAAPIAGIRGERAHLRFLVPVDDQVRLRLIEEAGADPTVAARLTPVHAAAARPGSVVRDDRRWGVALSDPPSERKGASPLATVVAEALDGAAEGYVLYSLEPRRGATGPDGVVRIREFVASTTRARVALWRHVASLDLTATFEWSGLAADDPLFHLVNDPRRLAFTLTDGLFVRVIDVARAVAERAYRGSASTTVELVDDACPWNAGRWRFDVGPDGASCTRTSDAADLTLSARELGAAYLGGPTLRTLALAGRVDEHTIGAVDTLSDAFAGALAPACFEVF